eukprot:TRINITY_DN15505_c0_g1_i1.p1 TRINITY_DN15505_c0_g1~~TRINITY_DN15505_c0_g1_i1.p1  ORF type:complete len:507 (+),score=50.54 TRINITY_DN15505_c0_g1_i1:74-1594(+)
MYPAEAPASARFAMTKRTFIQVLSMILLGCVVVSVPYFLQPEYSADGRRRLVSHLVTQENSSSETVRVGSSWLEAFADWMAEMEATSPILDDTDTLVELWNASEWYLASRNWVEGYLTESKFHDDTRPRNSMPQPGSERLHMHPNETRTPAASMRGSLSHPVQSSRIGSAFSISSLPDSLSALEFLIVELNEKHASFARTMQTFEKLQETCTSSASIRAICPTLSEGENQAVDNAWWFMTLSIWISEQGATRSSWFDAANFTSGPVIHSAHRRRRRHWGRGHHHHHYYCFPGEAEVLVRKEPREDVWLPIATLQVGQHILVEGADRTLKFEPVLTFLHSLRNARGRFIMVLHEHGILRATAEHLIYVITADGHRTDVPMKELRVGDRVLVASESSFTTQPSRVLHLYMTGATPGKPIGMYAPLTSSGSVVVDRTVASVYASAPMYRHGPHAAYHSLFAVVRMFSWLKASLKSVENHPQQADDCHCVARFFERVLGPWFLSEKTRAS